MGLEDLRGSAAAESGRLRRSQSSANGPGPDPEALERSRTAIPVRSGATSDEEAPMKMLRAFFRFSARKMRELWRVSAHSAWRDGCRRRSSIAQPRVNGGEGGGWAGPPSAFRPNLTESAFPEMKFDVGNHREHLPARSGPTETIELTLKLRTQEGETSRQGCQPTLPFNASSDFTFTDERSPLNLPQTSWFPFTHLIFLPVSAIFSTVKKSFGSTDFVRFDCFLTITPTLNYYKNYLSLYWGECHFCLDLILRLSWSRPWDPRTTPASVHQRFRNADRVISNSLAPINPS